MKYQHHYQPSNRSERWRDRQTEYAFRAVDTVWGDVRNFSTTAVFSTGYVLGLVSVPPPPPGCRLLVEGTCNLSWSTGSALDAFLNLEIGTAAVATSACLVDSSAGSFCGRVVAMVEPQDRTNVKCVLRYNASRTAVDIANSGLVARWITEG